MKLYHELADWWPLLSPVEDYADEAEFFRKLFYENGLSAASSLLELGSGGGSNAFYLQPHFAHITLTDLSPQMLAISQRLNPGCSHQPGDMRTLRLDREFDGVFIHDAVAYMTTPTELRQAMQTAFVHCKPGGVVLFAPDDVRETFESHTAHGGNDGNGRALRYLEWVYDPDETDTTCVTEFVYVLREAGQPVRVEHEQHLHGVFSRTDWQQWLADTGFQVNIVIDSYDREIFVAHKPC